MFAEFIIQSGRSRTSWAEELGISKSYMSDVLNGNRCPSLDLAVRIERLTAGAVPATSWVPELPPIPAGQPAIDGNAPSVCPAITEDQVAGQVAQVCALAGVQAPFQPSKQDAA